MSEYKETKKYFRDFCLSFLIGTKERLNGMLDALREDLCEEEYLKNDIEYIEHIKNSIQELKEIEKLIQDQIEIQIKKNNKILYLEIKNKET